jgi:hypothetical protein
MDNFNLIQYLSNNPLKEASVEKLSKKEVIDIGFASKEEVNNLSFDVNIKNVSLTPGILLHQIIEIGIFDLPNEYRKGVKLKPYHILFGEDSLTLYNAFGVNTTAGLPKSDCEEFLAKLKAEGKTEKDDAFIGGLVNFAGPTLYQFFNMQVLDRPNMPYRLIPHESLHVARNLISFFENPKINPAEENWWENPEYVYTDLKDASEEFFAEVLERATEIAFTRYNEIK